MMYGDCMFRLLNRHFQGKGVLELTYIVVYHPEHIVTVFNVCNIFMLYNAAECMKEQAGWTFTRTQHRTLL
jgi:hypothetical protein